MAENEDDMSIEELQSNLVNYEEQLQQVEGLLALEPGNAEYEEVRRGLQEVIGLTQELLSPAQQAEVAAYKNVPSDLTHTFTHQRVTIPEDFSDRLPVGSKVQAVWSGDGEWYNATIEAITHLGYMVWYEGWGNKEEVDIDNVRVSDSADGEENTILDAEKEAEATRLAIKRKIAECADVEVMPKGLPPKLRINSEDPEDVKAAKKKKIHAFKSKVRLEQMEITQNKRQNAWQQFQSSKGKTKKVGFFTGRKRESIFKSPDDPKGKVGVTGSGKGITEFQKREKHLHLKVGNEESED